MVYVSLKKEVKKFRVWVDNIKIGLHTIKPGQIIVFLHYNWYIICHIYILCQWDSDVKCPGKGVYGHYCLVKIIKIIDKITFFFSYFI